jgi:phage terminase Nu1 subunit (DNA packaging protein)
VPTPANERLNAAKAERAERINRVEAGELVEAAAVALRWADTCVRLRQRLMAIPLRIGARHPAVVADLDRELRAALEELADGP